MMDGTAEDRVPLEAGATGTVPRKSAHNLCDCRGPADFLAGLARHGVDVRGLVERRLKPGVSACILLAGSLAEGMGTPQSDIDLLVLVERRSDVRLDGDDLHLTTGRSDEVLEYVNGLEFNLEFVARDRCSELLDSFLALAPALYDPKQVERFSIIERFDLRFLHRLRTGWILHGEDVAEQWRDEFLVDLLPTYLSIRYYFEYLEFLEDLQSVSVHNPSSVPHIGRLCAESAAAALLASAGFTSQSRKWFVRLCEQVGGRTRELLDSVLALMFPPQSLSPQQIEKYVADLTAIGSEVASLFAQDPEKAEGVAFLRSEITYAVPPVGQ